MNRTLLASGLALVLVACGSSRPPETRTNSIRAYTTPPAAVRMTTRQATAPVRNHAPAPSSSPMHTSIVHNGQPLPTLVPGSTSVLPPAAWIVQENRAIPATYGSYCYAKASATPPSCVDWFGELPPQISPASLSASDQLNILVGIDAAKITNIHAAVHPLFEKNASASEYQRTVTVSPEQQPGSTILVLQPIGDVRDQLLAVSVSFEGGGYGGATYLWRLNP